MTSKINPSTKTLYQAILTLKTLKEVNNFLKDLLTPKEIEIFTKRFQMAKLLDRGLPYVKIAKQLKVSTTTVTRTALFYKRGNNGYKLALKRLKKS